MFLLITLCSRYGEIIKLLMNNLLKVLRPSPTSSTHIRNRAIDYNQ